MIGNSADFGLGGLSMQDEKMRQLCTKISMEQDSAKLMQLVEELTKHLNQEQKGIEEATIQVKTGKGNAA